MKKQNTVHASQVQAVSDPSAAAKEAKRVEPSAKSQERRFSKMSQIEATSALDGNSPSAKKLEPKMGSDVNKFEK